VSSMPRCAIRLNASYDALTRVQLVTDRKEPSEILEAYDSVKLGFLEILPTSLRGTPNWASGDALACAL
jgi:hypothetical protein